MNNKIKAIIVEDEVPAQELIKSYLESYNDIELIDVLEDGYQGLKAVNEHKPDLLFLDIQTPKLTGFELLDLMDANPIVIFSTAYDEYAIKAFENNAADYLLKPYSKSRFDEALQKAKQKLNLPKIEKQKDFTPESINRIVVKTKDKIEIIKRSDIICLEADDDYVRIVSNKGEFLKNDTLKKYENKLGNDFIRVHRSFIVNINFIENLSLMAKDSYDLLLRNGKKVKVSKSGYKLLKEVLGM